MRRSRLEKFNACEDCLDWQIRRYIKQRKENYQSYMEAEIREYGD